MKKWLLMLMMVLGLSCFADYYSVSSGYDRYSDINNGYPGVVIVINRDTQKYNIYRFTYDHGMWVDKGVSWRNAKEIETEISNGAPICKVMKLRGRKCVNLTEQQLYDILDEIHYEEAKD